MTIIPQRLSSAWCLFAAAVLAGCIPGLPSIAEAPRLAASSYGAEDPVIPGSVMVATPAPGSTATTAPTGSVTPKPGHDTDAFTRVQFQTVKTKTRFTPVLSLGLDRLNAGTTPTITIDVYQTKEELEVKELRTLIENTRFRFDQVKVGQEIGDGQMDVGTPPKATLRVSVKVEETDNKEYLLATVKATNGIIAVYIADLKINDNDGNLQIVSVGNLSRANDDDGRYTTEFSARVVQKLFGGLFLLPDQPGPMRIRNLFYSEPDKADGNKQALVVNSQTVAITP